MPEESRRGPIPREAVEFLERKGVQPGFSYLDVWAEEHHRAFTAAKVMREDVLEAMHQETAKALREGKPYHEFSRDLGQRLQQMGWWGEQRVADPMTGEVADVDVPSRLHRIYDTNMRTARAAGQWERVQRTKDTHPYLLYQLGPSKEHRPEHVAWHGLLLHVDDPFWQEHFPPNGWGCKCWVRQVSRREAARLEKGGITAPDPRPVLGAAGLPTGHVDQSRKVPVRTERPATVYVDFKNKRTGAEERVPKGIDPGFHRPPTALTEPGGRPPGAPPASALRPPPPVPTRPLVPAPSFPFASREAEESMATFTARARDLSRVPGVKDVGDIQAYMDRDLARLSNRWLKEWKVRSTDANAAAARVIMGDAAPYDGASGPPPKTAEEHGASFAARIGSADTLLDAMRMRYAATQAMLGKRRLKKMKLYRGLNDREADSVRASLARGDKEAIVNLRPLSSWSTDEAVARRFGSVVVMAEIPVEQAFSHHRVDPALAAPVGDVPEQEVIVYSPELQIRVPARRVKSR